MALTVLIVPKLLNSGSALRAIRILMNVHTPVAGVIAGSKSSIVPGQAGELTHLIPHNLLIRWC